MWFEFTTARSGRKHLINLSLIRDISEDKDGNAIIHQGSSCMVSDTPYAQVRDMLRNWRKLIDFTWQTPDTPPAASPPGPLDDDIPF